MPGRAEYTALNDAVGYAVLPVRDGNFVAASFGEISWRDLRAAAATIEYRAKELNKLASLGDKNAELANGMQLAATDFSDFVDQAYEAWGEGPEGQVPYSPGMDPLGSAMETMRRHLGNFEGGSLDTQ